MSGALNLRSTEDLYAAVGAGDLGVSQVVGAVSRLSGVTQRELGLEPRQASPKSAPTAFRSVVLVSYWPNRDLLSPRSW